MNLGYRHKLHQPPVILRGEALADFTVGLIVVVLPVVMARVLNDVQPLPVRINNRTLVQILGCAIKANESLIVPNGVKLSLREIVERLDQVFGHRPLGHISDLNRNMHVVVYTIRVLFNAGCVLQHPLACSLGFDQSVYDFTHDIVKRHDERLQLLAGVLNAWGRMMRNGEESTSGNSPVLSKRLFRHFSPLRRVHLFWIKKGGYTLLNLGDVTSEQKSLLSRRHHLVLWLWSGFVYRYDINHMGDTKFGERIVVEGEATLLGHRLR